MKNEILDYYKNAKFSILLEKIFKISSLKDEMYGDTENYSLLIDMISKTKDSDALKIYNLFKENGYDIFKKITKKKSTIVNKLNPLDVSIKPEYFYLIEFCNNDDLLLNIFNDIGDEKLLKLLNENFLYEKLYAKKFIKSIKKVIDINYYFNNEIEINNTLKIIQNLYDSNETINLFWKHKNKKVENIVTEDEFNEILKNIKNGFTFNSQKTLNEIKRVKDILTENQIKDLFLDLLESYSIKESIYDKFIAEFKNIKNYKKKFFHEIIFNNLDKINTKYIPDINKKNIIVNEDFLLKLNEYLITNSLTIDNDYKDYKGNVNHYKKRLHTFFMNNISNNDINKINFIIQNVNLQNIKIIETHNFLPKENLKDYLYKTYFSKDENGVFLIDKQLDKFDFNIQQSFLSSIEVIKLLESKEKGLIFKYLLNSMNSSEIKNYKQNNNHKEKNMEYKIEYLLSDLLNDKNFDWNDIVITNTLLKNTMLGDEILKIKNYDALNKNINNMELTIQKSGKKI